MSTQDGEQQQALHWLMVGYVSPGAETWIKEAGGQVITVHTDPQLLAVALAYNPKGAWKWSHGRQEHREGVEYWSTGELQEASTGISLQYRNATEPYDLAEYCNASDNYLILPDEEYDPQTRQVKEPESEPEGESAPASSTTVESANDLDDLDEDPF